MRRNLLRLIFNTFLAISMFILLPKFEVYADGIYEVKYTLNYKSGTINFTGVIFYYTNQSNSNVLRFRFYNGEKWQIIEERFKVVLFNSGGKNYWVIKGIKSYDATDTTHLYNTHDIFLSKSPSEEYYSPDITYTKANEGGVSGRVSSFKVLNRSNVTNAYLSDFAWQWPNSQDTFLPTKIDLILVSNSNDSRLGNGFDANHRILKSTFRDIARVCGIGINIIEINGDNFNKSHVIQALNSFSPSTSDIVIFYYSGHGFHKNGDSSAWPSLDMRQGIDESLDENNTLSLDNDIYQPLCTKGARLTLIIGECCNTYAGALFPIRENPPLMAPSNMLNPASVKKLFNKTGKLLIATSSVKEPSYYSASSGGDFCNEFISSIMEETGINKDQDQIKWSNLINSAFESTKRKSASEALKQNPIQHFEIID